MSMVKPASSKLFLHLYTSCCFLLSYHVVASAAASPFSFSFDFSNTSTYHTDDLLFEGDAAVHGGLVDLTDNSSSNGIGMGRMSYKHPVPFYDNTTGQVASFATRFTFAIRLVNNLNTGDGLAFFLSSYPSRLPLSLEGGDLGLRELSPTAGQLVAVEFDTFRNDWDPCYTYDHMAIDIHTARSSTKATCFRSFSLNGSMTASITFNSSTRMLLASLHFDDHPSRGSYQVSTQLTNPVMALLPSEVAVGFSSAAINFFEVHQIMSWSFNSTLPRKDKKTNSKPIILTVVIVIVVLIFLLAAMCILRKLYWKEKSGGNLDYAMFEEETPLHIDMRRFTYAELNLITKNFDSIIARGGFGTVYHGILENGDEVAVKVLMETSIAKSMDFLPEVETLPKVHHKNLVTLQGYCQNKKCLALVYDFMPNGNLQQILRGGDEHILNWERRLHIAFDAAQVAAGTLGYLDPEYHATFQLTVKTDVYSFGIVLLEIVTGQPPVIMNPQPIHLPNWVRQKIAKGSIHDVVDKRLLDQYNVSSLRIVIDLAMCCVENASTDRPAMTEVVSRLKVLLTVVSNENRSIHGTTQHRKSMESEFPNQYQSIISRASTEASSFQSGYTGRMSEISMSSGM